MFSVLFAFSLCEEYCDETTNLTNGYVCCNNKACSGYCFHYEDEDDETKVVTHHYYCASMKEKYMCVDAYIGYFATLVPFFVPTLIMYIIASIMKTKLPKATWVGDFLLNWLFGTSIYGAICAVHFLPIASFFLVFGIISFLLVGFFRIMNLLYYDGNDKDVIDEDYAKKIDAIVDATPQCNCCGCCCGGQNGGKRSGRFCNTECLEVLKDLRSPKVTKEELQSIIEENHLIPPTPQIEIIDFEMSQNGPLISKAPKHCSVEYGSWEEETPMPHIGDASIIAYKCHSKYRYDNDMRNEIEKAKKQAQLMNPKRATYQACVEVTETSGITHRAIGVDGNSKIVGCCSSCIITHFLYKLLSFFGYSSIIDTIWLSSVQRIEETSIKKISFDEKTYRSRSGERDKMLVEFANAGDELDSSFLV